MQCKTATMIGDLHPSENQESIVLITDIDSSLYDYKLMKLQNGNVNLVKTQVHIAIRFFKASNDDINEKKRSLTKIQIDYLKKRIHYIDQILRQMKNSVRRDHLGDILDQMNED